MTDHSEAVVDVKPERSDAVFKLIRSGQLSAIFRESSVIRVNQKVYQTSVIMGGASNQADPAFAPLITYFIHEIIIYLLPEGRCLQ